MVSTTWFICARRVALGWVAASALACSGTADVQTRRAASAHAGTASPPPVTGASIGTGAPITPIGTAGTSASTQPAPALTPPKAAAPVHIDTCTSSGSSGASDADLQKLAAGGLAAAMRLLYPYDATVFPRGLSAPLLMWDGAAPTLVMLHVTSQDFDYRTCLKPDAPGQLALPKDLWDMASARTLGATAPFVLEFTALSNGVAQGPLTQHFVIAQATLKGSIFYNSYSSHLLPAGQPAGAVLRIPQGGKAELFVSNDCTGCHSVSADGSRLISQSPMRGGQSFKLTPMSTPNPTAMAAGPNASFGALYPDGSVFLSTSTAVEVARAGMVANRNGSTSTAATLYSTDSGSAISGTGIPDGALMPTFSPSGRLLVFNDNAINNAHGLALMDFDLMTRKASNRRVLFTDSQYRPGWPFLLPDDHAAVFTRTSGQDFSGEGAGLVAGIANDPFGAALGFGNGGSKGSSSTTPTKGPISDLYMVDIKTGTATVLAHAMGYATAADAMHDTTYLPFGAEELHQNYFPTVSPVGAGGYFWIFFDSVRHYGNQGVQRQLWGAAIDIASGGDYTQDHSHPAFYLPGQEFGTGNHRAFAALDPCKQDGNTCSSGVDCCGGFCSIPSGAISEFGMEPVGMCSSSRPMCAKTGERCTTDSDCCPPMGTERANTCIAGFCTVPGIPQ